MPALDLITDPGTREFLGGSQALQSLRLRENDDRRRAESYQWTREDRARETGLDAAVRGALRRETPISPWSPPAISGTIPADDNPHDLTPGSSAFSEITSAGGGQPVPMPTINPSARTVQMPQAPVAQATQMPQRERLMDALTSTPGGGRQAMALSAQDEQRREGMQTKALEAYSRGDVALGDHYAGMTGQTVPDQVRTNKQMATQILEAGQIAKAMGYDSHDPQRLNAFVTEFMRNGRNPQAASQVAGTPRPATELTPRAATLVETAPTEEGGQPGLGTIDTYSRQPRVTPVENSTGARRAPGAQPRELDFEARRKAYLAVHPDDPQGALDYANKRKVLTPDQETLVQSQIQRNQSQTDLNTARTGALQNPQAKPGAASKEPAAVQTIKQFAQWEAESQGREKATPEDFVRWQGIVQAGKQDPTARARLIQQYERAMANDITTMTWTPERKRAEAQKRVDELLAQQPGGGAPAAARPPMPPTPQIPQAGARPTVQQPPLITTPAGQPPQINSEEEFNALPPGAEFIAPDGTKRRKP